MSPLTHATRTLLLFGCTTVAMFLSGCGPSRSSSSSGRFISLSWSVIDRSTGTLAPCARTQDYGADIFADGQNPIYLYRESCTNGVTYATSDALQKGTYIGALELLAPNGEVLLAEPTASFDLTAPGEHPYTRTYEVDDVCAHNRYFMLKWETDRNGKSLNCAQGQDLRLVVEVDVASNPPQTFELGSNCWDGEFYNWQGFSDDGLLPGAYTARSNLLSGGSSLEGGTVVSQTASQTVTVGTCSPGLLADTAFAIR